MKNLGLIKRNDDILTKKYYDKVVNQIPTGTVEGDSITINDSSDLPVKDVVIKGKTEQDGTPTPDSKVDVHRVTGDCSVTKSNSDNTSSQTYPLTLRNIELCKIGTYEDYIYKSGSKWYLYKAINKITLDGSENWAKQYGDNLFNLSGADCSNYEVFVVGYGLSNYYKYNSVQSGINNNTSNGEFALQIGSSYIFNGLFIKNENFSDVDDFKSWLNGHNTYIYYPIATPTTTEITDTTLINQLEALINAETYKNITHIDTTGEDLAPNVQVVYRKDLETMLNNLQAQILA